MACVFGEMRTLKTELRGRWEPKICPVWGKREKTLALPRHCAARSVGESA